MIRTVWLAAACLGVLGAMAAGKITKNTRRQIPRADEFAGFRIVPKRVRNALRIDH